MDGWMDGFNEQRTGKLIAGGGGLFRVFSAIDSEKELIEGMKEFRDPEIPESRNDGIRKRHKSLNATKAGSWMGE